VDHKALTTMRLDPKGGYCYARVSNPLHGYSLQGRRTGIRQGVT
jgi:hypothetical protein